MGNEKFKLNCKLLFATLTQIASCVKTRKGHDNEVKK